MGDCPSTECHEKVDGHQKTLYGADGRTGLVADVNLKADKVCLKKYIPKPSKVFIGIIFTLIVSVVGTAYKVWSQQEVNAYIYADKTVVEENKDRITALENNIENMQSDISDIKDGFDDQKEAIDTGFKDIAELIRER